MLDNDTCHAALDSESTIETEHAKYDEDIVDVQQVYQCDILDAAPKIDMGSLEHPMFSLSKRTDHNVRQYHHNGNTLTIAPGLHGLATIWDKDVLIYCISQVVEGINRNREDVSRTVWVTAYDLLTATNRPTCGVGYQRLEATLSRLQGTQLTTNLKSGGKRAIHGFGLIDSWEFVGKSTDSRMIAIEITLSQWLYNAIKSFEVLTISKNYFMLRKGIERRMYEIAKKHCGQQASWKINLVLLHKKSGSVASLKEFRRKVKSIAQSNQLPEYHILYTRGGDCVKFYRRRPRGEFEKLSDLL